MSASSVCKAVVVVKVVLAKFPGFSSWIRQRRLVVGVVVQYLEIGDILHVWSLVAIYREDMAMTISRSGI